MTERDRFEGERERRRERRREREAERENVNTAVISEELRRRVEIKDRRQEDNRGAARGGRTAGRRGGG